MLPMAIFMTVVVTKAEGHVRGYDGKAENRLCTDLGFEPLNPKPNPLNP